MLSCYLSEIPPGRTTPIINPGGGRLWALGVTLSGRAEQFLRGDRVIVEPGDVTILKPNGLCGWRVLDEKSWKLTYAMLLPKSSWVSLLDLPETFQDFCLLRLRGRAEIKHIRRAMLEAYAHYAGVTRPQDMRLAWNSIEKAALWINLAAHPTEETRDPRLDRITAYIRKYIGKAISLHDMAGAADVSISTMHLLFRRRLNTSPMAYVEGERMKIASEMLKNTNLSVKEISFSIGYPDQRYFASRFRHHTSHSPSEYRILH
ncbi:MAG: AraC family transcriptional regulator [Acidobacteria bacterium]|nr:AraC family transcriptional regulator [Acidobacteriota bacterium]